MKVRISVFVPNLKRAAKFSVSALNTVKFGSWPRHTSNKAVIPPFGSILSRLDVCFGISTVILKLRPPAGGLICPPLFSKHYTASTPLTFAGTWETLPLQILILLKFPCLFCTDTTSRLLNCKFPGFLAPGCAVETPQKCMHWSMMNMAVNASRV